MGLKGLGVRVQGVKGLGFRVCRGPFSRRVKLLKPYENPVFWYLLFEYILLLASRAKELQLGGFYVNPKLYTQTPTL